MEGGDEGKGFQPGQSFYDRVRGDGVGGRKGGGGRESRGRQAGRERTRARASDPDSPFMS